MIASGNPALVVGFLGCMILGNLTAVIAAIGSCTARRRRGWLLVTGFVAAAFGGIATAMFAQHGDGWDWVLALCASPLILGTFTLIRWSRLPI